MGQSLPERLPTPVVPQTGVSWDKSAPRFTAGATSVRGTTRRTPTAACSRRTPPGSLVRIVGEVETIPPTIAALDPTPARHRRNNLCGMSRPTDGDGRSLL